VSICSVTLGRYCTPCPTYRVDTTYLATSWPNGDKFPFGPAVYLFRQLAVRQVLTHDAYVPSSKILSIVTCSGRHRPWSFGPGTKGFRLAVYPLSPLARRLPVLPPREYSRGGRGGELAEGFDSQSPAVGQHSLPSTLGVGVDEQRCSSHLVGHTVVQGSSN